MIGFVWCCAPLQGLGVKMLQVYKPDSVSRLGRNHYHLSAMAVANHLYLPTLDHQASSTQAVLYMAFQHARFTRYCRYQQQPWALTPHFHPYCVCANTNTAVIFCGTFSFLFLR